MLWLYSALTMQKPSTRAYSFASGASFACSFAYFAEGFVLISFHILSRIGNFSACASTSTASCPRAFSRAIAHFAARPPIRSLNQAAKAIAKSNHLHAVVAVRCLADTADGGIQAGAVATGGEDADAPGLLCHFTPLSDS